jgi:3-oxoacyl-[acyl-carrier protein] reductase
MLANKTAIIYGGGGAIGGAVARSFAREGARVFLAGRTLSKLAKVAADISAEGGEVEVTEIDAFDEEAVKAHADLVAAKAGGIDIALNAIGLFHVQGTPFLDLALDDYAFPIIAYAQAHFITAKAVAWHMAKRKSGVILTLSTPGGDLPGVGYLGFGIACAAIEGFSRLLACELAPSGIRCRRRSVSDRMHKRCSSRLPTRPASRSKRCSMRPPRPCSSAIRRSTKWRVPQPSWHPTRPAP